MWAVLTAVGVVALTAVLVVGLMNRGVDHRIDDALDRGERPQAPAFTLPLLTPGPGVPGPEGRPVSLDDFRGRVVVLNLWASWCGPCKNEAPYLQAMADRLRDRDVVLLGMDIEDLSSDATAFMRDNGLTYASVRDPNDDVKSAFGATGVPETFVIDREGRIALTHRTELGQDQAAQIERIALQVAAESREPTS